MRSLCNKFTLVQKSRQCCTLLSAQRASPPDTTDKPIRSIEYNSHSGFLDWGTAHIYEQHHEDRQRA